MGNSALFEVVGFETNGNERGAKAALKLIKVANYMFKSSVTKFLARYR